MSSFASEEIAGECIARILRLGSAALYEKLMENRSLAFAAKEASASLYADVCARYVSADPGDDSSFWFNPSFPSAPAIDSLAKGALPIIECSPARQMAQQPTVSTSQKPRHVPIHIPTNMHVSSHPSLSNESIKPRTPPEESALRANKERALRRASMQSHQSKKKASDLLAQSEKNAKIREDLKTKNFSYDHDGNIVFTESVDMHRLPHPMATTSAQTRLQEEHTSHVKDQNLKAQSYELSTEVFTKFNTQQPPAVVVMDVKAGVTLTERGKMVRGADSKRLVNDSSILSRQELNNLLYKNKHKI